LHRLVDSFEVRFNEKRPKGEGKIATDLSFSVTHRYAHRLTHCEALKIKSLVYFAFYDFSRWLFLVILIKFNWNLWSSRQTKPVVVAIHIYIYKYILHTKSQCTICLSFCFSQLLIHDLCYFLLTFPFISHTFQGFHYCSTLGFSPQFVYPKKFTARFPFHFLYFPF